MKRFLTGLGCFVAMFFGIIIILGLSLSEWSFEKMFALFGGISYDYDTFRLSDMYTEQNENASGSSSSENENYISYLTQAQSGSLSPSLERVEIDLLRVDYANVVLKISDTRTDNLEIYYPHIEDKTTVTFTLSEESGLTVLSVKEVHNAKIDAFKLFSNVSATVIIFLPESYRFGLETNLTDSNVELNDCTFNDVSVKTTNGFLRAYGLDCSALSCLATNSYVKLAFVNTEKKISVKTTNGYIDIDDIECFVLNVKTTSRNISVNYAVFTDSTLVTSEGYIYLNEVTSTGSINASTVNKYVEMHDVICPNLRVRTQNGDVDLSYIDSRIISVFTTNAHVKCRLSGSREDYFFSIESTDGTSNTQDGGTGDRAAFITTTNSSITISYYGD